MDLAKSWHGCSKRERAAIDSPSVVRRRQEMAFAAAQAESEAAPEPAAKRPALLSSWRAPPEPVQGVSTVEVVAPQGPLGLVFERGSTALAKVKDTSPLLNSVQVGWTLVSLDDVEVADLDGWAVSKILQERAGDVTRLLEFRTSATGKESPAAPAREEAESTTQIRAPEAAKPAPAPETTATTRSAFERQYTSLRSLSAAKQTAAAAADEESGAAEKSGAAWRPAYALALAAALVVCVMQLLALMPHLHWASVIFEHDQDQPLSWHVDRIHWDVVYDLWGWDAIRTIVWTPLSAMDTGQRERDYLSGQRQDAFKGSSCSASVDRDDPGGLGGTACAARNAARAGTIICLALAFMVSGALAKLCHNPAWTRRGKSPEWLFKALGSALAVGGAVALGFTLFYSSAQKRALNSGPRDECPRCEHHGVTELCDECGVVGCSQGCVNAIVGGALALFAGCAMAVYGTCCYDCEWRGLPGL